MHFLKKEMSCGFFTNGDNKACVVFPFLSHVSLPVCMCHHGKMYSWRHLLYQELRRWYSVIWLVFILLFMVIIGNINMLQKHKINSEI